MLHKCAFIFILIVKGGYFITGKTNSAELLWNLTGLAIHSRQYPSYYAYRPEPNYNESPHLESPIHTQNILPRPESFLDALSSIARHDDLQCVPRLLCEITSGTLATGKQSTALPFNIDTDSLLGFLSALGNGQSAPILLFGKAALFGYTSRGSSDACVYEYPRCPQNSDRLVDYLNNYNGGFFRFFNGVHPQPTNFDTNYELHQQSPNQKGNSQRRILNKHFGDDIRPGFRFPNDDYYARELGDNRNDRHGKKLKFPSVSTDSNELDFQRPLPNHKVVRTIFPDRTGTGELLIDTDIFLSTYRDDAPYSRYFSKIRYP